MIVDIDVIGIREDDTPMTESEYFYMLDGIPGFEIYPLDNDHVNISYESEGCTSKDIIFIFENYSAQNNVQFAMWFEDYETVNDYIRITNGHGDVIDEKTWLEKYAFGVNTKEDVDADTTDED